MGFIEDHISSPRKEKLIEFYEKYSVCGFAGRCGGRSSGGGETGLRDIQLVGVEAWTDFAGGMPGDAQRSAHP